jgi:predicted TIM-barrel fold metal-dependent hydrolase
MIVDTNVLVGKWKYDEQDLPVARVKALLAGHSIDRAFVASTKGIFFNDTAGNEETRAICQENPQFLAVATVDLGRMIDFEDEICLRKSQGFKALRVFSEYQGFLCASIRFRNLMKNLEKNQMPLIIKGTDREMGSHIDEIVYATSDFDLPVIILDAIGYNLAEAVQAAHYTPNVYFSTRLFNTAGAIERFWDQAGNRLVFGSGIPFYYGNQSVLPIAMAGISEEARAAIYHQTILKIMGESV